MVVWGVLRIVTILLEAGADVNAIAPEGWTPLHIAASWKSKPAMAILLRHGGSHINWRTVTNGVKSVAQLAKDSRGDQAFIRCFSGRYF